MTVPRCALLLLLLPGCRIGEVPTTPLLGPAPEGVLVLSPRNRTGIPDRVLLDVVAGVDTALRERGYRVLSLPVGFDLLRQQGIDPAGELSAEDGVRLKLTADVDAVLVIDVHGWQSSGRVLESATWDLDWRLLSTHSGGELWRHHDAGSWRPAPSRPLDPTRAPDAEPDVQPFGSSPSPVFRDAGELALALHRTAFQHLPRRLP